MCAIARGGQADADAQESARIHRAFVAQLRLQEFTTGILEKEDCAPLVSSKGQGLRCPGRIEFGGKGIFVFQAVDALRPSKLILDRKCKDREPTTSFLAAIETEVGASGNGLQA